MRFSRILCAALLAAGLLLSCSGQKSPSTVIQVADANYITGIAADGNTVYCATQGGLVTWDLASRAYSVLTTADGLPANTLTDAVLDGKGRLWVSSDAGVAMRDGSSWKKFDASSGLSSNTVNDLTVDTDGTVWAATAKGIVSFKGDKPRTISDPDGPVGQDTNSIYTDSGKNVWVGTEEQGIFLNLQGTWKHLTSRQGLLLNTARTVAQNWDNSVWVGSASGVCRWDGAGFQTVGVNKHTGTFDIRKIIPTREYLWFFTATGVHSMKGSDWVHFTETEGLISNAVNTGLVVSDDRVFAGTPNGLSLIEKGAVINYSIPNTPFGKDFIALAVDGKNRLYAGARETGLNLLDGTFWSLLPGRDETTLRTVQSIVFAPDSTVVFNTTDGVAFLRGSDWTIMTRDNGIAGNDIRCGVYDTQGRYWVGTSTGVSCLTGSAWTRYRGVHGLPSEDVRACALDSNGAVWFGTASGIVSFSEKTLTNWTEKAGGDSIDIRSAAVSGNTVFFGTGDGKLIEYDGKSWKSSGKAASAITFILPDPSGALWLATDGDGIIQSGGNAKYTVADGLPSNRVRALTIHDGNLVAACYGGLGFVKIAAAK